MPNYPDTGWASVDMGTRRHFFVRYQHPAVLSFYESACKRFSTGASTVPLMEHGPPQPHDCPACIAAYLTSHQPTT